MAKTWRTLLIYRIMDREIKRCASAHFRGRLLDIGCGVKPYRKMLAPHVSEHVGLDREQPFNEAAKPDLVGTATSIPSEGESFDCALSTASLEHLDEPEQALRECFRVLKKGGVALYTIPLLWHVHSEPWDYYRFTEFGIRHLFGKVGFELLEVKAMSGFWVTSATMFCYYIGRFHRSVLKLFPIIPLIGILSQAVAWLFELVDRPTQWTWMYIVAARKR